MQGKKKRKEEKEKKRGKYLLYHSIRQSRDIGRLFS